MKLIDADKLKKSIRRNDGYGSWNEFDVLCAIDREPEVLLSCPKCHGNGKNKKYIAIKGYSEYFKCKLCNGTGKIGVDEYERIQRLLREIT